MEVVNESALLRAEGLEDPSARLKVAYRFETRLDLEIQRDLHRKWGNPKKPKGKPTDQVDPLVNRVLSMPPFGFYCFGREPRRDMQTRCLLAGPVPWHVGQLRIWYRHDSPFGL